MSVLLGEQVESGNLPGARACSLGKDPRQAPGNGSRDADYGTGSVRADLGEFVLSDTVTRAFVRTIVSDLGGARGVIG